MKIQVEVLWDVMSRIVVVVGYQRFGAPSCPFFPAPLISPRRWRQHDPPKTLVLLQHYTASQPRRLGLGHFQSWLHKDLSLRIV